MPGTTAAKGLPYPLGTDRVMDGDDQIRKLAQAVDNMVQAGNIGVNVTTGGTPAQVVVVFPVPYASPPTVVASPRQANANTAVAVSVDVATATQVAISLVRSSAGTTQVNWMAVGPVSAVALSRPGPDESDDTEETTP